MNDQYIFGGMDTIGRHTRPIRIAYTLNNTQPVRCSYIGEEPFFYLDEEMSKEDSFGFNAESLNFDEDDQLIDQEDGENADDLFIRQFSEESEYVVLSDLLEVFQKSKTNTAFLEFAKSHGVTIEVDSTPVPALYDRTANKIVLQNNLRKEDLILVLARELRRAWQHRQGALLHPLLFHPDHAIIVNRVQAADLMVTMVHAAWELKLAGEEGPWKRLEQGGHTDLTQAFSSEAKVDFRALNNGRAAVSTFEAWFMSERCRRFDRQLIQQMLSDYQGYVFKAGHEESSRVLTQQLIAVLGTQPVGRNYLAAHGATILADPIFTDIRDRSNANFLWFIKFEQSFREAERDLTPVPEKPESVVIALPQPEKAKPDRRRKSASRGAAIVDFQRWKATRPEA